MAAPTNRSRDSLKFCTESEKPAEKSDEERPERKFLSYTTNDKSLKEISKDK